jgi:hypothetical protein
MNDNGVPRVRVPASDATPKSAAHHVTLQLSSNPSAASSSNSQIGTNSSMYPFFALVTPVLSNIKLQLLRCQTFGAKCSATPLFSNMRGEGVAPKFVNFPVPKTTCRLITSQLFLRTLALRPRRTGQLDDPDGFLRVHRTTTGGPSNVVTAWVVTAWEESAAGPKAESRVRPVALPAVVAPVVAAVVSASVSVRA